MFESKVNIYYPSKMPIAGNERADDLETAEFF